MHAWHTCVILQLTGVLLVIAGLSHGQFVDLDIPLAVERGSNAAFTCTATSPSFLWQDVSENNRNIFLNGLPAYPPEATKYANFNVSESGDTSIMTIWNTQIEDEGLYSCTVGQGSGEAEFTVEVQSTWSLTVASPLVNGDTYEATCDALNGRPEVTITWMIGDSGSPCDSIDETLLPAPLDLFSKRSVCTFQATSENYGETLRCIISGHQVAGLDGEENTTLVIHSAPASTGIMTVGIQSHNQDLRVTCDISAADQPNPTIMIYYITSNDTLIHQSSTGVNHVDVAEPNFVTDFLCMAGNYLGNTTSPVATYDPSSTATPPTVTTEPSPTLCTCDGLSSGASAGIAILAVLLAGSIIINVMHFIVWRRRTKKSDKNGSQKVTSSDVGHVSNEANDTRAYEMIQSGDRAYTALKLSSSGTSRSAIIDPENVTFLTRLGSLGRGDFGAVWKGELRSHQGRAAVAIRQIPDHVPKSTNTLQSVKLLCELTDQPNVVRCLGFCQEQSSIIYEFISGGTLLTHLQTTGVQSQPTYSNLKPNRVHIDEDSLLNFAWQIAKGMQFLASKNIIHGTLCAHNVLLGDRKQCKLSDYGLPSSLFSNRGKPTRWSCPETMVTGVQSTEGDIWSFGIVLWEIVTLGARPYPNMTFDTVQKEVSDGYKMPRPRHCGQDLYTIMSGCWETEGRNRIRFHEILKTLERILEKTHDYLSLSDLDKDLYASPLDV